MDRAPARRAWLLASLAPFVALAFVRPWTRQAFAVWDYPELIPILRRAHGVWDGTRAIAVWNWLDGRANYLSDFQYAFTFVVVGDNPVGWQWQRALFMLAAGILLVWVARRLGATPLAAAVAALVYSVSVPGTEGWLVLAAEPLGVVMLLLLAIAAAGYTTTPAWRLRGVLMALLAAGVMLAKEILGLCLPVLVLLAVCWDPEKGFRRPAFGPRERWLAVLLLVVLVLEAWSVGSAMRDAVKGSYASQFGRAGALSVGPVTLFQAMFLPARFSSAGIKTVLYPANLAFLLLLVLGLARKADGSPRARGWWWWVLGLLFFPAIGALAYGVWYRYSAFYGIPFFLGSAGLLALAATSIERGHPAGRAVVAVLGVLTVGFSAIVSSRTIRQKYATANLTLRISRTFPAAPRLDTLFVVTPRQGGRRWPITGRELQHYALAFGVPDSALPVMRDAPCEEVASRLEQPLGRSAILNDQNPCGRLDRTLTWAAEVRYLDWLSLKPVADTMRVDLLAPSWEPFLRRR
ncbi:MAG TPA: hypothetical protein VGQ17_08530 [Gemmatimonadales bacterium]|nr:hypothetical protein [Gemmatimonadales bacterium]